MSKKTLVLIGSGLAIGAGLAAMNAQSAAPRFAEPEGAGELPKAGERRIRRQTRKIVYHSTSRSFTKRVMSNYGVDPLDPGFLDSAIERYLFTSADAFANAIVVPSGAHAWLGHPDRAVWHSATPEDRYASRSEPPAWWHRRWPGVQHPADLIGWRRGEYINNMTVSIDVVPMPDSGPIRYTPASLNAAAALGRWLAAEYGLSLSRADHLAHSDLDPWNRGNAAGGWDPGWDWRDFMQRLSGRRAVA